MLKHWYWTGRNALHDASALDRETYYTNNGILRHKGCEMRVWLFKEGAVCDCGKDWDYEN